MRKTELQFKPSLIEMKNLSPHPCRGFLAPARRHFASKKSHTHTLKKMLSSPARSAWRRSTRQVSYLSDPVFAPSLKQVSKLVSSSLDSLSALRPTQEPWTTAIETLGNIAKSPRRSLFRPQLVFLGSLAGMEINSSQKVDFIKFPGLKHIESFAAGVEMQHLYMVVHDDVMDHGTIRRGLPTVQVSLSKTGLVRSSQAGREVADHLAILIGDSANAASVKLMVAGAVQGLQRSSALDIILDSAIHAGAAQFEDVIGWQGVEQRMTQGEYLHDICAMHAVDIASFHGFTAPLIAGFRLTKPEIHEDLERELTEFGNKLGTAFYGLQDVADIVCDSSETGKDSLQDLREGRLCMPLFTLRKFATEVEWEEVSQILRGFHTSGHFAGPMSLYDRRKILSLMQAHRVIGRTIDNSEAILLQVEKDFVQRWKQNGAGGFAEGCQKFVDALRNEASGLRSKI